MNAYNEVIYQLENFIKKYYKAKLIRGLIIFFVILISFYILISLFEFFIHFSTPIRGILFFSFFTIFLFVLTLFVLLPISKLFKLIKRIDYKTASIIISSHFPDIKDKLLNILELNDLRNKESDSLVTAAVTQKAESIKVFRFRNAINYKNNLKYFKYLIPVLLIFIGLLTISPTVFKESNKRLINYNKEFIESAPFNFYLLNDTLDIKKGNDLILNIKVMGSYIPNEVFINYSGNNFLMRKDKNSKTNFSYEFKNLNNSFKFYFSSQDVKSNSYKVNVLPAPAILNFTINVNVPAYTGDKDSTYTNIGDIVVPFGSSIKWSFFTRNVDSLCLFSDSIKIKTKKEKGEFIFEKRMYKNFNYSVSVKNINFTNHNLINFNITVIPDLYPSINVREIKDTSNYFISYFGGNLNDDYGINSLRFKYRIIDNATKSNNKTVNYQTILLPFSKTLLKQDFYYSFDFNSINAKESDIIQYYFEVWDNDAVSGSKSAKTQIMTFKIPSFKDQNKLNQLANDNIQSKLEKGMKLAEELKKDLKLFREKNLEGNTTDWENKQLLNNILQKQDLLKELTKELAKENHEKNKMQNQMTEKDEELLKKQEEIQKLLDEIMTDELKDMMKQLQDLQDKFDENLMNKLLEDYEFSYEEMSERLDRTKELLKKEQVEQKINRTINELEKLSEEEQKLSIETENKKTEKENLKNKQNEIKKLYDEVQKEYDDAKKLNDELKNKLKLEDFNDQKEEINKEFNTTDESLDKGKNSKASQSQSKNAQNLKKLAKSMQSMMQANSSQQQGEDMESLRRILENLLSFSFKQEQVLNDFKRTSGKDPKFIKLSDQQLSLKEDFIVINDSLKTLAQRVSQISKPILDELYNINSNLREVQSSINERNMSHSGLLQNHIMTSSNNLALLLSSILDQMKNQQSSGSGSGSKNKKPGKQVGFDDLKGSQESIKKQMEELLKQMKEGSGSFDKNAQNKQLAKMLAQQEIFRQMLKEMNSKFSLTPETQKLLNQINKMAEENEKDIVNKRITPELIERQKLIESRLLEAEKSENKRETENKRESEQGKEIIYKSAKDVFLKSKDKNSFNEDLYKNNLQLKNFYKKLYDDYSKSINK